ncbi:MAG: AAA family ATPase [Candidatus Aminicenantes bacterium]|nr:AAA family ATPase [Candidatus Aminicenantes bacterium]NIM83343.1 AAA family ATPase [Candidatus Aminicenantes bacterium]NIN22707.1 AAA family ATPase [Candidatus Aminicenantes bacterium]NIN46467.1 AAA family ATPase [Candidatus Aminicenantes bacterium]NIN89349.1 AAA family ATPase [Candidatus Aminicenantes bacterium]
MAHHPEGEFVRIPNPYTYDIKEGRTYYNKAVTQIIKQEFETKPPRKIVFIQGSEGSGKSSTLERIKNDPEILGEKYTPIYVHSNRVISGRNDDLLLNLYECLKTSIDGFGMQIFSDTVDAIRAKVSLEDLHHFLSTLEHYIKQNHAIILLMFDDFDEFFEQENIREQIRVIRFFKEFSDESEYVRIILSGRRDLHELLDQELDSCLHDVLTIKMKVFDTREFYKAITEPVKDWVTYSPQALEEIRKMTGGNLYCLQLLCHYIISYLNTQEKNTCDSEDVAHAAELTIRDEREDFNHFWERLSVEDKLVCSAIMDEHVVKKRGLHYFIEQSSLLHNVFKPEVLNDILNRLYTYDFILKMEGRRFEEFPFKIPLYGYWLRKEHPFVRTVVEHFDAIARDKDFPALGEIVKEIPKEWFPHDRQNTIEFIREWFKVKTKLKESGRIHWQETEELSKKTCRILDLTIKERALPGLDYFTIDFKRLNIGSIEEALLLIQDRLEPEKDDIQHLRDIILTYASSTKPCLFLCLNRNEKIDELVQKTFLNIILIDNNDLKTILFSSRPLQALKEILFQRISSSQISPYQTDGPAITTFYGRQRELRMILGTTNRSFTIVGARKIGKSSLLARIKNELDDMGAYSVFMDLESPSNPDYTSFLQRMELEMSRLLKTDFHFENNIDKFCNTVKQFSLWDRKLIVILDEIDELLLFDKRQDYRLIKSFRSLFQEGYCQFILSGFEVLQNVKRDFHSPFFNFCEEMQLGPLEKKFAMDLITEPMANIGISYENPEDRELILGYTSHHPNLIQFFCKHLIEKLDENEDTTKKRLITGTDIKDLYNFKYDNYVIDNFYMFYLDLGNLEKLVVILLLDSYPHDVVFSIDLVNQKLMSNGIDLSEGIIHRTIQKLILRFILLDKGKGTYTFALPHFPEILKSRVSGDLKSSLLNRVKEGDLGKSV